MPKYNDNWEGTIFDRDRELKYKRDRLEGALKKLVTARRALRNAYETVQRCLDYAEEAYENFEKEVEPAALRDEARWEQYCKKQEAELERLKAELAAYKAKQPEPADMIAVNKACTISIFDSIIFAISNWSTDGQTAPDIELACQSILFPLVYRPVMQGNTDYNITKVPVAALEVVRRGRHYVQSLRQSRDILITNPDVWKEEAKALQTWWVNDALPLLYGARDEDWDVKKSMPLDKMIKWRDMPASRVLEFPLIWDGMELVKKHAEEIRELSELPKFNKEQLTTRIEP